MLSVIGIGALENLPMVCILVAPHLIDDHDAVSLLTSRRFLR